MLLTVGMKAAHRRELCQQIADRRADKGLTGPYAILVEGAAHAKGRPSS
jgi:hypothetical protein